MSGQAHSLGGKPTAMDSSAGPTGGHRFRVPDTFGQEESSTKTAVTTGSSCSPSVK